MLVGIDIIENERFARALKRHPGLVERVFTQGEAAYCRSRPNPVQHFAARFAAKEAVGKALGTGVLSWREIEIGSGGKPDVRVSGSMKKAADRLDAGPLSLSMSHCGAVSVSVAVACVPGGEVLPDAGASRDRP
ncbi:MAG: holo-ACP synthase [Thermoleophilia bacterium]